MRRTWLFLCGLACYFGSLESLTFNSDLTKVLVVKPGEILTEKITLYNDKDFPENVALSQADYFYNCEGENFFEESGSRSRSNAKWISLNDLSVTIPPHTSKDIYYRVCVPTTAGLNGSYSSAILVEPDSLLSASPPAKPGEFSLNIKIRYAHQIITNVGQANPYLKLIGCNVQLPEANKQELHVDVLNTGNYHLRPLASLKLFNSRGELAHSAQLPSQNILPESSVRFIFHFEDIAPGTYTAVLLFDAGNNKIFGEKAVIQLS